MKELLEGGELQRALQAGLSMEMIVRQGDYRGYYRTKIEDRDELTLTVAAPYNGSFVPLQPGEGIEINFVYEQESYQFAGEILSRQVIGLPVFVIPQPRAARRKQRRNFVRMGCFHDIYYQLMVPDPASGEERPGPRQKGQVLDISGGGFLLLVDQRLRQDDRLLIHIALGDEACLFQDELLAIMCVVRRLEETDAGNKYRVSVEICDIPEQERDRIIRYVFDIERDLRRRGLI